MENEITTIQKWQRVYKNPKTYKEFNFMLIRLINLQLYRLLLLFNAPMAQLIAQIKTIGEILTLIQ